MTRLALFLAAMGALFLLGRRLRVEPAVPAPIPPDEFVPMAAWPEGLPHVTYSPGRGCTCWMGITSAVCPLHHTVITYGGTY